MYKFDISCKFSAARNLWVATDRKSGRQKTGRTETAATAALWKDLKTNPKKQRRKTRKKGDLI